MSNPEPQRQKPLKFLLVAPKGKKDSKSNQKPLFNMAIGVLVSLTPEQHLQLNYNQLLKQNEQDTALNIR